MPAPAIPHRPRRWPYAVLLLVLAAAGTHAAALYWMAGQIETGLSAWAAQRRAQGWQVTYGTPERGGWPWGASLRVPELRLASSGVEWRAENVTLSVFPRQLDQLHWLADGAQQLALDGPLMPLRAARLGGDMLLNGSAPPVGGGMDIESAELESPFGPILLPAGQIGFEAQPGRPVSLSARLRGLTLPAALLPPAPHFGPRIDNLTLDAVVSGPLSLPAPSPQRATQWAAQWRDAGGRLEVHGLTLRWGPAAASAAATLQLDAALQPVVAGTVRLANPQVVLDAMTTQGAIPPSTASTLRRVLPLLMRLDPGGGSPVIELPLAVQDQTLSIARFPVLRLQRVEWQ